MSDSSTLHAKILGFLAGEFARKEGRQCVGVDLLYAPGNGFKDDEIRKWVRADQPELFDNFAEVEKFVGSILEIAESEADAKPAGKHRFVVRTHQHLGGRATMSFALQPSYNGSDEMALVTGRGGSGDRPDVIANHAGQLMRINAQMFDGAMRYFGQQNMSMHEEIAALRVENTALRRQRDEALSNKEDREFQYGLAAEKNARINAGFQKLLQIGTVMAAKVADGLGGEGGGGGNSGLAMMIAEFGKSLRQEQIDVLMQTLDMTQKMMFMEIMNSVMAPEGKPAGKPASLPSNGANGAP